MGISPLAHWKEDWGVDLTKANPDPKDFRVINTEQYGSYYLLWVQYPKCPAYEGYKLMLFDHMPTITNTLDPHFSKEVDSPIARFAPNVQGWNSARMLARILAAFGTGAHKMTFKVTGVKV